MDRVRTRCGWAAGLACPLAPPSLAQTRWRCMPATDDDYHTPNGLESSRARRHRAWWARRSTEGERWCYLCGSSQGVSCLLLAWCLVAAASSLRLLLVSALARLERLGLVGLWAHACMHSFNLDSLNRIKGSIHRSINRRTRRQTTIATMKSAAAGPLDRCWLAGWRENEEVISIERCDVDDVDDDAPIPSIQTQPSNHNPPPNPQPHSTATPKWPLPQPWQGALAPPWSPRPAGAAAGRLRGSTPSPPSGA